MAMAHSNCPKNQARGCPSTQLRTFNNSKCVGLPFPTFRPFSCYVPAGYREYICLGRWEVLLSFVHDFSQKVFCLP